MASWKVFSFLMFSLEILPSPVLLQAGCLLTNWVSRKSGFSLASSLLHLGDTHLSSPVPHQPLELVLKWPTLSFWVVKLVHLHGLGKLNCTVRWTLCFCYLARKQKWVNEQQRMKKEAVCAFFLFFFFFKGRTVWTRHLLSQPWAASCLVYAKYKVSGILETGTQPKTTLTGHSDENKRNLIWGVTKSLQYVPCIEGTRGHQSGQLGLHKAPRAESWQYTG